MCVFESVCVSVCARKKREKTEFLWLQALPFFKPHLFARNGTEISTDDVFLPLRRGQISEEHYRCLIMNDRLIKLI